jgi:uncharacterized protein YdaU (DUF1376 family)
LFQERWKSKAMTPDLYIPLDFRKFLEAVEGMPDSWAIGYLRALCHYWGHEHCEGLRNDSEYLRRLFRISPEDWVNAEPVFFDGDNFFYLDLENNKWHQKRMKKDWDERAALYAKRVKQTRAAALARHARNKKQREN